MQSCFLFHYQNLNIPTSSSYFTQNFSLCFLGVFNKSIFFRLDRICEDCYSLFREVELHSLCKWVWTNLNQILASAAKSSHVVVSCITQRVSDYQKIKEFTSCDETSAGGSDSICILVNFHGELFSWIFISLFRFFSRTFSTLPCKLF